MLHTEDNDSEDEWYFDSITRYCNLSMFELQNTPFHVQFTDEESVCIASACNTSENNSELLELYLPTKSNSEIMSSDVDLKLKCGLITDSVITQVQVQYMKSKVFTSEENIAGAVVYDTNSDSGQISKTGHLHCSLVNPQLAISCKNEPQIIMTQDCKSNSFVIDINTGKECMALNTINIFDTLCDKLIPLFLHNDELLLLNRKSGGLACFDLRTNTACNRINTCKVSDAEFWTCSSDFILQNENGSNKMPVINPHPRVLLLSDNGTLLVYDSRNWSNYVEKHSLLISSKRRNSIEHVQLKCSPFNRNIISVSGFDNSVYVYNICNGLEELFIHDGHSHVENCNKESVISSHSWVYGNSQKQILSSSFNKTLQLWEFS